MIEKIDELLHGLPWPIQQIIHVIIFVVIWIIISILCAILGPVGWAISFGLFISLISGIIALLKREKGQSIGCPNIRFWFEVLEDDEPKNEVNEIDVDDI